MKWLYRLLSETSRCEKPPKINDLKLVNGIGPVVERRFNVVGIYTYAQLSALSPADLAAAVDGITGLTAERIIKQDWIGQAHKLMSESISSEAPVGVEALAEVLVPPVVTEPELAVLAAELTEPVPLIVAAPGLKEDQIPPAVMAISEPICVPRLSQIETELAVANMSQNFFAHK